LTRHQTLLAGAVGLWLGCAGPSTVRIPVDDTAKEYREVQRIDCGVYDERTRTLTAGINLTLLFGAASGGPSVGRSDTVGVKWERTAQGIVAQYKELCARHNAGAISQAGYDTRVAEIDQLYAEAMGIRQSADQAIREHSRESFSELDHETAGGNPGAAQAIAANIDALHQRVVGQH
jgi:hypothetical protein